MSNILPRDVSKAVKEKIYLAADEAKYISMSKPESGAFMDGLVKRTDIGGIISQHVAKAEVRTYIKDGVLNAYSKAHVKKSKPKNISKVIQQQYNFQAELVETCDQVEIYVSSKGTAIHYIVVSYGTFLKWETALRKALLCVAEKPFGKHNDRTHILLILMAQGKLIAPSDKDIVQRAIAKCGAKAYITGEQT